MKKPKARSLLFTCLMLVFLLIGCLLIAFIGSYIFSLPQQASELYGPPAANLSLYQHYRLSYELIAQRDLLETPRNSNGETIIFHVEPGESIATILGNLEQQGLIWNTEALRNYLIYTGLDTQLQSGDFVLSPALDAAEMITQMLDPNPQVIEFNILAGWRMEEIAASLAASGLEISEAEFIAAASQRPAGNHFFVSLPPDGSMEGFFLPDQYQILRKSSAEELVTLFIERFQEKFDPSWLDAYASQGLSLYEAVTLASVVEKESILAEERPVIASVFLNRLAIDMKLESDPTVQYALGYNTIQNTWWTNPLNYEQLQIDSAYNTYRYAGLMPGPIANPSLSSLQAVAFPAQTPYYFFRATCDNSGRHQFAQTFEEHLNNACD